MIKESLSNILPKEICNMIFKRLNIEKLYELRFRSERPVTVNYGGKYYFLSPEGIKDTAQDAYVCRKGFVNDIVVRASEHSLYAVNDRICGGFLTIAGGVRIGIAGEVVIENNSVKTVKNFNSVNIRIPHEIKGCAKKIYDNICTPTIKNSLIISPPGAGKTTMLRDLTRILGSKSPQINVLLADERNEIAACSDGICTLDIGVCTDVINSSNKDFAFLQGVRSMRPDVIITDEIFGERDNEAIESVCACGVKVLASVHADGITDIKKKRGFENILDKKLFDRFVCLSSQNGPGTLDGIYNENFEKIY